MYTPQDRLPYPLNFQDYVLFVNSWNGWKLYHLAGDIYIYI